MLRIDTIKGRLMLISLTTTGIALVVVSLALGAYEFVAFRRSLVDSLTVQATMIGDNCTAALTFNDSKDAAEVLNALRAAPNIVQATVYTKDGKPFAHYRRAGGDAGDDSLPSLAESGPVFGLDRLSLARPILLRGERIGGIFIQADLDEFYGRAAWYAVAAVLAFAGAMMLAFLLLSGLQQSITGPIHELAQLTNAVSRDQDYSVRCAVRRDDETGTLARGFNDMLAQLQQRDRELEEHHRRLEHQVALRTAELAVANEELMKELAERRRAEDQLRHAQKMEAVGLLAGGVAHDFNNILSAIVGYGALLQMKLPEEDPLQHNIAEILAAAQRAVTLTQGLLTFSRKQAINPRPADLNAVINRVTKFLARLIGEDIRLTVKPAPGPLTVIADPGQLDQVLMNLATNARDAMPGGGLLHIETRQAALDERFVSEHRYGRAGEYALILISDTGTGMDADTAARIFEPFFTTKELGRGTGLGLSIVYGIVKQHNGYILVDSEPGRGTTFKLYLPLAPAAAEGEQEQPPVRAAWHRGRETVLLAEDDGALRKLERTALEECGYTVLEAQDGEEALERIRTHGRDIRLLLMDLILPRKNGREVYEEARKLFPGVKALFMSGYTAEVIRSRGILDEGQHFISKPIVLGDFLKVVRDVLDE